MKTTAYKFVSATLIISLVCQIGFPYRAFALTSGPSQPEVQAFEPIGTTEMVDLFSGDFVYNIPLLDIDGYPINISYHSGISMEQEASWVGLGWSLNPGEINRSIRGVPDDFNGDKISKQVHVMDEKNYMGKVGAQFKPELFGLGGDELGLEIGFDLSLLMNMNNYKGLSASVRTGVSAALKLSSGNSTNSIGFSPDIGVGSQSGVDLNASLQYSNKSTKAADQNTYTKSLGIGSGVNSRNGVRGINFSAGISAEKSVKNKAGKSHKREIGNSTFSTTVPIGIQNYVPVVTNSSSLLSFGVQGRIGGELWGGYANLLLGFTYSKMKIDPNGDRDAFGYMYLENAPDDKKGILDFIRDKDGVYNKTIQHLPMSSLAYDVFSVSGQGTGGSFRPFRNDIGTVYDPQCGTDNFSGNLGIEIGVGGFFELGADVQFNRSIVRTGAWLTSDFQGEQPGSLYEKLFYKAAGELTYNRQLANNALYAGAEPLNLTASYGGNPFVISRNVGNLNFNNSAGAGSLGNPISSNGMKEGRTARGNNIIPLTAKQASDPLYSPEPTIRSYSGHVPGSIVVDEYSRLADNSKARKNLGTTTSTRELADKISLISQVLPDGKRYIYGIPAQNNLSKDVTYGVTNTANNTIGGLMDIGSSIPASSGQEPEKYHAVTTTPGSAHSFLLTEVLSPDYVDITGNGISDDDLGGFVKLNYTLTSSDYRWRSPAFDLNQNKTAHFDPGFQSDPNDGKASVSLGSREQWYAHSIESKNTIAEFYTSPRADGQGMEDGFLGYSVPTSNNSSLNPTGDLRNRSFKLDSIRLFNKNERIQKGTAAIPIKTVIFDYDYSLCQNTPNSDNPGKGKLTLKQLFIRYGNSDKNLLNPYKFEYNAYSANYDYNKRDRWGNVNVMDPTFSALSPFEFPYTSQVKYPTPNTDPATAFSLTDITLPSGGKIHVDYEADDYAFVQDKRAMEMFKVIGFGADNKLHFGNTLYEGDRQYNYVYFKRDPSREYKANPSDADLQEMYLGKEKILYFSVSNDINGNNAFEQIKGFARIKTVGICPGQSAYGYIELEKTSSGKRDFSPVTLYAMNYAKWNLNHIVYPGNNTASLKEVLSAFGSAFGEIAHMRRPLETFLERGYCKGVKLDKSWIRLASPNCSKKGGGTRVKRLTASDEWSGMTNSSAQQTGTYGRDYKYTYFDKDVNATISSGVASYEPLIGGDENPLRQPIPYTAAGNLALPAIEFYQLEPMGESFYPGGMVGYSSVTVRSIHIDQGKSSMSEEENTFYTSKDFPIRVEKTNKNANSLKHWSLFAQSQLEQVSQGYTLYLNDMHGKPKGKSNYVVLIYDNNPANPKVEKRTLISGMRYNYKTGSNGRLNNNVRACRLAQATPGAPFQYVIENMELGKESDLVFDSRQNFDEFESLGANGNLNTIAGGFIPIPFVSVFPTGKIETTVFHSAVGTKIIQQYGILQSVDVYQEDETTPIITTENLIYDAESGNVLLTKTNNEFGDPEFAENLPAFLAYESMGPSYTNHGFKDKPKKIVVNAQKNGYMEVSDLTKYSEGDELLYEDAQGKRDKLWITKKGMISTAEYFGYKFTPGIVTAAFFSGSNTVFRIDIKTLGTTNVVSTAYTVPYPSDIWNHALTGTHVINIVPGTYDIEVSIMQNGSAINHKTITGIQLSATTPLLMYGISVCDPSASGSPPPPSAPPSPSIPQPDDPLTSTTNFKVGEYCFDDVSSSKCMLRVNTRYKSIKAVGSSTEENWWVDGQFPKTLTNFTTEIVRSGRRNMLGNTIQSAVATSFPSPASITSLSGLLPTTGLISVSTQTYTNSTVPFEKLDYSLTTNSVPPANLAAKQYDSLNDYVLGLKGNFRPYQQFTAFADRAYGSATTSHSRFDGLFNLGSNGNFWQLGIPNCGTWNILAAAGITNINLWKKASEITKYDQFGNAIEEEDALQIPSAVRFGYSNRLPVCVASNARQQNICFEGFEDLNSKLVPEATARLFYNTSGRYLSGFFQSAFSQAFSSVASVVYLTAAQAYVQVQSQSNYLGGQVTLLKSSSQNGRAHTGTSMLALPANSAIEIPVADANNPNAVESFKFLRGGKYLMNIWVKTGSTSPFAIPFNVSIRDYMASPVGVTSSRTLGTPIDGWQLVEATIDFSSIPAATVLLPVRIDFSAQAIIDDVRILPYSANLKSFVYDVDNNDRISAELDENHYATFFEYDQEGQLVRVKKETEKGIVTLNESRRSLKKN